MNKVQGLSVPLSHSINQRPYLLNIIGDDVSSSLSSGKKISLSPKSDVIRIVASDFFGEQPLALERNSSAPALVGKEGARGFTLHRGMILNNSSLNTPSSRYSERSSSFNQSELADNISAYGESCFSASSLSSNISHVSARGQDGIVELKGNIAIKRLHQKLLSFDPDCCKNSVITWNEMYKRLGLNALSTAKVISHEQYSMPRIIGLTLAEQNKNKEDVKNILRDMKNYLSSLGINHTDLVSEVHHNPKNIIFSDEYNRYLPIDVEGIELVDVQRAENG